MLCKHCGAPLADDALICRECGQELAISEEELVERLAALEHNDAPIDPELASLLAPYEETELPAWTEPERSSKKGLIITVSALITALLLAVGGWFLYQWLETSSSYEDAVALRQKGDLSGALELFLELEDYKDSQSQSAELIRILDAKDLLKWQDYEGAIAILEPLYYVPEAQPLLQEAYRMRDYRNAMAQLEAGEYENARQSFAALGDYLDSREYAESKVSYLQAQGEAADAEAKKSPTLYLQAGERYRSLGDYQDAADQASHCYLQAALLYLAAEDVENAEKCTGFMSAEDLETYSGQFHAAYADSDLIAAWNDALILRSELSQTGSFDYSREYTALEAYLDRAYLDEALKTTFAGYMDILKKQQALVNRNGTVSNYVDWLTLELDRIRLVKTGIETHDLLANTPNLRSHYLSQEQVVSAYRQIEKSIQTQLVKVSASQNEDGSYYVPYKNDTGVGFTLEYTHYYYSNGLLYSTETHTLVLKPGDTVKIPVNFPENEEAWDTWKSGYTYRDLKLED